MSQTPQEIAKEIVIAAIQNGYIAKHVTPNVDHAEMTRLNSEHVSNFYKKVFETLTTRQN